MTTEDLKSLEHELAVLQHFHRPPSEFFVHVLHPSLVTSDNFLVTEWEVNDIEQSQYVNHVGLVLELGIRTLDEHLQLFKDRLNSHNLQDISFRLVQIVKAAHEKNIVLMDFKGANVMLFEYRGLPVLKGIDFDGALAVDTLLDNASFMATAAFMAPELILFNRNTTKGAALKAKKSMDMWSLGILVFQVFQSATGLTFWTALLGINDEEDIKAAIAGGKLSQQSIDNLIDLKFSGTKNTAIRHFLPKLLKIDPLTRATVYDLERSSLLQGGASISGSTLFQGQQLIMKKLDGISEQLEAGFSSLAEHLDEQLVSIQGTVLRGNTKILTELEGWLQSLQQKLASYQNFSSSADISSLRKELEKWQENQSLMLQDADAAFHSYSETLMTQLEHLFLAQKSQSVDIEEFMSILLVKMESIHSNVSSIREDISFLMDAFSAFGKELSGQLKNSDNRDVLAKLHEIQHCVASISIEQEKEKKLVEAAVEKLTETNSILSQLGVSTSEIEKSLIAQTARLDVLIKNTHHIPTLMVLIPVVKKGVQKLNFLRDEARLVFFCSVTLERVPCGKDGDGYKVNTLKPWVKKAIPVLKVGLILLQLGLLASGVPIPVAGLANSAIDQATKKQYLSFAANMLQQQGTVLDVAMDEMHAKTVAGEAVRDLQQNDSDTRSAYEAISLFLKEVDPTLQYLGLTKQTSRSGKVAWIKQNAPEVLKQFMDTDGANMP